MMNPKQNNAQLCSSPQLYAEFLVSFRSLFWFYHPQRYCFDMDSLYQNQFVCKEKAEINPLYSSVSVLSSRSTTYVGGLLVTRHLQLKKTDSSHKGLWRPEQKQVNLNLAVCLLDILEFANEDWRLAQCFSWSWLGLSPTHLSGICAI